MTQLEKLIRSKFFFFKGTRHDCEVEFNNLKEIPKGIVGKKHGTIKLTKSKKEVSYDSTYEEKILKDLDKCSYIKEIKTQSLTIPFKKSKTYYPDIQILLNDGSIVIIEVKPAEEMINKNNMWKYKALRKYCKEKGYACTEIDIDYYSFEDLKKENVSEQIQKEFINFVKDNRGVTFDECKNFKKDNGINNHQICNIIWNNKKYLKYQKHRITYKKGNDTEYEITEDLEKIYDSRIEIEKLDISCRLKNILLKNGIVYFEELIECPKERIASFKNAGKKTVREAMKLKKNPELIKELIMTDTPVKIGRIEKVEHLEKNIDSEFIEKMYSDFSLKDLNMSIRLKNCLYQNRITTVTELLKTPITEIASYRNLGEKTLNEAADIKIKLLDVNGSEKTWDTLYFFIKKLTSDTAKSVIFIKNYLLQNTKYNTENFLDDLNKLKNDNKIEITMDGIRIKKISILDYIDSIKNLKVKEIIDMRLDGATFEEIGKKRGVTRERIRQIFAKNIAKAPDVRESMYRNIFEKYNFNESEFCKVFNESKKVYNFLKLNYDSGDMDIIKGLEENDFSEYQKSIIKKLRNKITIFGQTVNITKTDIIKVLTEEYARDSITFEEFTKLYNNYIKMNPEIELSLSDERSIEGILSRQDNIVFELGKKFRCIDIESINKQLNNKLHDALKLEDGYYSTLVIFNDNLDLMKEIDIKNEYELHSYFKKNAIEFSEIKFDRMPNFSLGGIDKHEFTLNKINELAPISINDFLDFMEKHYGHKANTFLSYLTSEFSDYINGNFIDSDVIEIKDELIMELQKVLTEPIYSLDTVRDMLEENGYKNADEIITKNSMYKIGYKIRSSYILRKDYDSVEEYYTELSKINDFIPNENIVTSSTYNGSIKRIEKNYDIILISDKEFITYKKLQELGISKEMINKFCNDVFTSFENINYFTIYNIKNMIDTSWIEDNGFDDIFYECLVETIDNIKFLRINNQKIYSFIDDNVEVEDIINEFMVEDSIYVDELIDDIKEKYGINVSADKLIYSDKFYSRELNKLYMDKECYYKEVYKYE